jgi:CheY-like chemotaxis protein
MDEFIGHDDLRSKLQQIIDNVSSIQKALHQVAQGPNSTVLGVAEHRGEDDPIIAGAKILVADDEPNLRRVLAAILAREGYDVVQAADGAEALRQARRQPPDVVVLDIRLPGIDGWAVLSALKADPATSDIPVIVVSVVDEASRGLALGAADYLVKGQFGASLLERSIRYAIEYAVERQRIVPSTATWITRPAGYERLVLSACHPLYSAAQRIVIFARLVDATPRGAAAQ